MGPIASNSFGVPPATTRDDSRYVLKGGILRYVTDRWLTHCAAKVERDVRWLGHDGVLADFTRASRG
jgi:hypothetical protein